MLKRLLPYTVIVLLITSVHGQQNHLMYFSYELPQANYHNPAYQSPCKWWIGVPVLSSIHLNYANSILSVNSMFPNGLGNTNIIDLNSEIAKFNRKNFIGIEAQVTLFGIGYHINQWYFNFTITEKAEADVFLSKKYIDLFGRGNQQFIGESVKLKSTGVNLNYYREFAFGASKQINSKLLAGAKAKILFGKLNATTTRSNASLATSQHEFYLDFEYDLLLRSSLPVNVDLSDGVTLEQTDASIASLLLNRKNPGFAVDLGGVYQYNNKINLVASIIDVGFIRWRSNLNTLKSENNIRFTGIDATTDARVSDLDFYLDTIQFEVNPKKYFKLLPAKLNLGVQYEINPLFNANFLITSKYFPEKWINTTTFSIDTKPVNWLYLTTGYTIQYGSYNNIGFGATLGHGPIQVYGYTDNLTGIIWPKTARNINVRFGMNIHLGCRPKDEIVTFSGSQVPCPEFQIRENAYKKKMLKRRKK